MAENIRTHVDRAGLEHKLKEWAIDYETYEHPGALPHLSNAEGMFAKNLFLRDKKKRLFLFCAPHDADIKLNDLAKLVGASGGLRFADENVLQQTLGLTQGAVTVFGIINDVSNDVRLVLDKRLTDGTYSKIMFHPMENTATLSMTSEGL
ncbi:PRXD1-like protein, partial [Mya arenaria]